MTEPFAPIHEVDAVDIAREYWQYSAVSATRLDSEMDDSFRLEGPDGGRVLKLAAPRAATQHLSFLCDLADWLIQAPAPIPTQPVVRTPAGDALVSVTRDGQVRAGRLLRFLPGQLLSDVTPSAGQWRSIGASLAALDRSLAHFQHAPSPRSVLWDLRNLGALRSDIEVIDDARTRARVSAVIDDAVARVLPVLADLPQQFIHNDFNRGNLLVDLDGQPVLTGVIDFGDAMVGPRVFDLAIAAAYAIMSSGDPWRDARSLAQGYLAVLPLTDAERAVLPDLVIARQAQRLVLNAVLVRSQPQSERHTTRYRDETAAQLHALLDAPRLDMQSDTEA